jgi:WD40 repeat protein
VTVPAPQSIFCVPHADPGERLIGRDAILEELDRTMLTGDSPTLLTALQGTGGIGKTQLAARYCWTRRRHHPGGIVWLNMADPARAVSELVNWAERLHLETTDPSDRAKANAVLGCVQNRPDALVVLDNLEDPDLLDRDLPGLVASRPRGLGCKLLITSRQQVPDCQEIRLDFLPSPLDSALLLREAKRAQPAAEEAGALRDLLSLLGGLPLALVMTGRLLADRPELSLVGLHNALRHRGAISVLSERGQIPPDYHQKIGSSFRAVLSEVWDALPEAEPDLRRKVLTALALFGENAFVPEDVLPLMLELPAPDPDGFDPPPLEQALARLEAAQLVERNRSRGQLRLHPLIQDFSRQQQEPGSAAGSIERVERQLEGATAVLGVPTGRLGVVARAFESLSRLDSGSAAAGAVADLCRLLRVEAHALSVTTDPSSGSANPAQLAYLAALHGRTKLKAAAEEAASASGRPYLRLRWTTAEAARSLRLRLRGHESRVLGCAVSADDGIGLSVSSDRTLIVWDLGTGEERHRLRGHEDGVNGCAVSAHGHTGLSASSDRTLIVWDLTTGQQRYRLRGHEFEVSGCAISADGRIGLSASDDQTLIVWDLATGEQRHRLGGHNGPVSGCAVSADGCTGLSASSDQTLIVWDLAIGRERHRLRGHEGGVGGCAVSADGKTGLSASLDRTLIVWDLATGKERHRLRGHERRVLGCAISADGCTGLSASSDRTLIVWNLTTGQQRHRLCGHEGRVFGCAVSADGRSALSASEDQTLIVWDLGRDEERQHLLRGHDAQVWACAASADGGTGLSASSDRTLIVWDLGTGEERQHLSRGHDAQVWGCAVSADGRTGLSASDDETVIVWDLATGQPRHRLRGHQGRVSGCAVSADGRNGLSASSDRSLIVWDLAAGKERHRLRGHDAQVWGCAVSADGRTGLSVSDDQTLIVWELSSGEQRHRLRGHESWVSGCAVSADGRIGLSASDDRTLIVWDLETGRGRNRLRGHTGGVLGCAVSADGGTGLSASEDCSVIIWDLTTGGAISRLALDSISACVALSTTDVALIGDRKGNVTCLEIVVQ